ncbi:hypothetical protein C0216_15530 [Streptomyces globosus]|uniref:Uncharacterized protein n=1 Tax=Streptomyces globosus TaxID=68209 RepID=A0A344U1B4_9ACTN|nr:hypothetical protein C0216_15530 [Streptomyces globosus]
MVGVGRRGLLGLFGKVPLCALGLEPSAGSMMLIRPSPSVSMRSNSALSSASFTTYPFHVHRR